MCEERLTIERLIEARNTMCNQPDIRLTLQQLEALMATRIPVKSSDIENDCERYAWILENEVFPYLNAYR